MRRLLLPGLMLTATVINPSPVAGTRAGPLPDQTDNLLRRESGSGGSHVPPTQNDLITKKVAELPLSD